MSMCESKTPVSIVHEYFGAIGIAPLYELIVNQTCGFNPWFVYRVTAGDYSADGQGSSKQKAKQNAAQLLIAVLRDRKEVEGPAYLLEDAIKTLSCPQDNLVGFNAVGALIEFCVAKNFPEAKYDFIGDEGPSHARIFTYKCTVSNINELGTARTKKQAKHHAAYAMLARLKRMCGEEMNAVATVNMPPAQKVPKKDEQATAAKGSAAKSSCRRDECRVYRHLLEKSPTVAQLAADGASQDLYRNQPLLTLQTIADELGVELETPMLDLQLGEIFFVRLHVAPILIDGAPSFNEAALRAIRALLSLV